MTEEQNVASLIRQVDLQLQSVHTQSLDISFNELADMVQEGELDISPDYQRLFQWSAVTVHRVLAVGDACSSHIHG